MGIVNIGLFVGSTDENGFENLLIHGAISACKEIGARLICFDSGDIRSNHGYESMRNVLYTLVDLRNIDAIIVSGAIFHNVTAEEVVSFCQMFSTIPMVCIAVEVPGIPCVIVDNRRGMAELMEHLLDKHHYRKIAFIAGPPGQEESEARLAEFKKGLQAHGIEPDDRLIIHGDFSRDSGYLAAQSLLAYGKAHFEGIVCANDGMALGAHDALMHNGITVPRDVFITGYDDDEESRVHFPPLTTVRQNPADQARLAVEIVYQKLQGNTVALRNVINSDMIIRNSCACNWWERQETTMHPALEIELKQFIAERLVNPFNEAIYRDSFNLFLIEFESMLSLIPMAIRMSFWITLQRLVRDGLMKGLTEEVERRKGDEILVTACKMFFEQIVRHEVLSRLYADEQARKIITCSESLVTAYTIEAILHTLGTSFPLLGFKAVWLSFFENSRVPKDGLQLQLVCSREQKSENILEKVHFESWELVPGTFKSMDRGHDFLVVQALYSHDQHLGIAVFSTDYEHIRMTGALRTQIGTAVQSVRLIEERRVTEHRLVKNEKMAALGNLVAGVAHELNTPIGVAVTGASYLYTLTDNLNKAILAQQLRASDVKQFVDNAMEIEQLILTNLERGANLVSSFKQVAVDQTSENRRTFALREYIAEALLSLSTHWKNSPVTINLEGPDNLQIDSYPGSLAQIVSNLVINALTHAFPVGRSGLISITIIDKGNTAQCTFTDNGVGISLENQSKIFEPFFTTRRGQGGTGLGLHIVNNIIEQILGGSISFTSVENQGTTFIVEIPKSAPQRVQSI